MAGRGLVVDALIPSRFIEILRQLLNRYVLVLFNIGGRVGELR